MRTLLDNRLYHRFATSTQWLVAAASVLQLLVSGYQYYLVQHIDQVTPSDVTLLDEWQPVLGYGRLGVVLLAFTAFITWFYRGYDNLHRVRETPLPSQASGWAIGGWFVPIMNFWYPYRLMKELWHLTQRHALGVPVSPDYGLVKGWWTLRLASLIVARLAQSATDASPATSTNCTMPPLC